jgi:hypothetical protein
MQRRVYGAPGFTQLLFWAQPTPAWLNAVQRCQRMLGVAAGCAALNDPRCVTSTASHHNTHAPYCGEPGCALVVTALRPPAQAGAAAAALLPPNARAPLQAAARQGRPPDSNCFAAAAACGSRLPIIRGARFQTHRPAQSPASHDAGSVSESPAVVLGNWD